jgi:lysophospholipase L1-like esterase
MKLLTKLLYTLSFTLLICSISTIAYACPLINDLVDFNCDQKIKVVFTGDSIVYGTGDEINLGKGGYPLRFKQAYPFITVSNNGIPGITSYRLYRLYAATFRARSNSKRRYRTLRYNIQRADLVILAVGINDYWDKVSPYTTVNYIRKTAKLLHRYIIKNGIKAQVVIATLTKTARDFQQPFVDGVNSTLLARARRAYPVSLRFDKLRYHHLNSDLLHPNSLGYDWMANKFIEEFTGNIQETLASFHTDFDNDQVYDLVERKKYFTSPYLADTDNDGYEDGEELFSLDSDPLDPLDPEETPEPEYTASPTPSETPSVSPSASESPSPSVSPSSSPSASASPSSSPSSSPPPP